MGEIEVHDVVIWARHIAGDPALRRRIEAMAPDDEIELDIDGVRGWWRKMQPGKDGRPTAGLKAASPNTRKWWSATFRDRKGERVTLSEVSHA